jgi:hypothetical protein
LGARWADPRGPWDRFRKPDVDALVRYASAEVQQALPQLPLSAEANPTARTPLWLNPPFRLQGKKDPHSIDDPHLLLTPEVTELIFAVAPLKNRIDRNEAGEVHLPGDALKATLTAIEVFADMLSVIYRANRSLGSPKIPIGLLPETNSEVFWLSESRAISGLGQIEVSMDRQWSLSFQQVPLGSTSDRAEGWALLADVFSQDWPSGRFRELWRFFERAFALPSGRLVGALGH